MQSESSVEEAWPCLSTMGFFMEFRWWNLLEIYLIFYDTLIPGWCPTGDVPFDLKKLVKPEN